jgi:putative ABC transport system permease protein
VVLGGVVVLLVNERAGVSAGAAALSPSAVIIGAFLALMLVLIGFALLTPAITVGTMALLRPLMGHLFGLLGRMAARGIVTTLSRTSVAIASLMVAVSVTIGVGIMVGSFRQTVIDWLETTIVADVYVVSPGNTSRRTDTTLDPATVAGVQQTPGVAGTVLFRNVTVDTPAGPTTLVAVRRHPDFLDYTPRNFKHALPDALEVREAGAIFISEPLAYRIGLGVGERLRLRTERGLYDFLIAAVYYDYSSDRGVIQMADQVYRAYWDDSGVSSIAVLAEPGVQVDALAQTLRETVGSGQPLRVNSNRSIREHALATFDRTFAITAVLQMLATIVAFIGILSALMALQLERGREVALLRANGLTPRQLWGMVLSQTGLMGLTAGLLAMPVGFVLALVLIFVINRHSFGWTLRLSLDPLLFAQALLVALVAAVLAGVYPAWRMGRTNPALMLREE